MLQRYATDQLMEHGEQPFERAAPTGKRIAVVGAGPAGLACAHRLALHGHEVVILDRRDKPGGLNEYGIAAYKTVDDFAQREVDFILSIGGITDPDRPDARPRPDARRAPAGLRRGVPRRSALPASTRSPSTARTRADARDAVDLIAELRQASDLSTRAGRAAGGGHRRRHDGDRRGGAVEAARRGGGDDRLSARTGGDEGEPLGAGTGADARRDDPAPAQPAPGRDERRARCGRRVHAHGGGWRTSPTPARSVTIPADTVFKAIGQTFEPHR